MSSDFTGVIKSVVKDMRAIGPPSFGDFCNRVHNKARSLSIAKSLGGNIDDAPNYPPDSDEGDWHNGVLDTLDADYWLEQLCNASLAQGILDGGGGSRTNDMRNCLDQEIVEARYLEAISILMPFCVGEWIAAYQGQEGHRTLRSLRNVEDFPEEFKKYLKNENTIQGEIDTAREDGDWRFPIYLLFAVDYLYYLPGDMLVYGDKVTLRPSFEILNKWSHSSWDDDGDIDDPKRMKDLAVFFGGASTIFFVAVNDTGLVRPSTTFATMEGFYGKALGSSQSPSYADAINKAIEDLRPDEEVVNEIKLWLETFADNYKSLHQDKWKAALDRASDQALESWALACEKFQPPHGLSYLIRRNSNEGSSYQRIQLPNREGVTYVVLTGSVLILRRDPNPAR